MSLLARIYDTETAEMVKEIEVERLIKWYNFFREKIALEGKVMTYNDLIRAVLSQKLSTKNGLQTEAGAKATVDFCISTGILLLFKEKPMPQVQGFLKYYLVESQPF